MNAGGSPPLDWLYGEEREESSLIPNIPCLLPAMTSGYMLHTGHACNWHVCTIREGSPPAHWVFKYSTTVKFKASSQGQKLDYHKANETSAAKLDKAPTSWVSLGHLHRNGVPPVLFCGQERPD